MNPLIQLKKATPLLLTIFALGWLALSERAQAVSPAPDGCYSGFTTAEGCNALHSLTTGAGNTGLGWYSLTSDTTGSYNTAVGAGTLIFNNGDSNTAVGAVALLSNTTGISNTAAGAFALFSNTVGGANVANGTSALKANTTGGSNVANGYGTLQNNTTGSSNVANGFNALLANTTGNTNTALGNLAGSNLTTGSGNVCIGSNVQGVAGASNTTWIRNVFDSVASGRAVYVNSDNKIGTLSSSRRYKEEIKPMGKASETLFGLKPVTFRYNKEVDRSQALSFGLIAEEVGEISPDLITRDKEGKPETVRYEAVNAMLLNEFLKEHSKVERLEATVANLVATVNDQAAQIQKVSARLEASKSAPQVVDNP